jgi:hypothetical protein
VLLVVVVVLERLYRNHFDPMSCTEFPTNERTQCIDHLVYHKVVEIATTFIRGFIVSTPTFTTTGSLVVPMS